MATLVAPIALAAGCDIGRSVVPSTAPAIVVHAVLDPSAPQQFVLVERTLTGAETIPDTTFDPSDPIASAGGIPENAATVEIIDSAGTRFVGAENQLLKTGRGTGVYVVPLDGTSIRAGGRYELHVHTAEGDDLTAFTRVPNPEFSSSGGLTRLLNRDHDTLSVSWGRAPMARTYALRIESPFGPFFLFTDSTHVRMAGNLRNLFSSELQHVFVPGFRQSMVLFAVDSNFYNYYRTNNDPFTGAGIISSVNGGLGLFGSIAILNSGTITVTADQTEPIEGRFRLSGVTPDTSTLATTLTLYIESKSQRPDVPDALSGRYNSGTHADGIIGQMTDSTVSLALLANQLSGDTVDVFDGVLQNGALVGSYRKRGGAWTFKKQ